MKARMTEVGLFLALVALGVAGRLLPHEPNLTPLVATALFSGFVLRRPALAAGVPLASLLLSDAVLGVYDYRVMGVVYLALVAPVLLGPALQRRLSVARVGAGAVGASLFFFAATNLAVWLFSGMYAPTLAGLGQCYVAALPFLRNALLGDLLWAATLFGAWAVVALVRRPAFPNAAV